MKKIYSEPEMKIITFLSEDVITLSGGNGNKTLEEAMLYTYDGDGLWG